MIGTIAAGLRGLTDSKARVALRKILFAIGDRLASQATASAGLVIKTGGSTLAKTGSTAYHGTANGVAVTIAASTDMPALTGLNITAAYFNVACFFIDQASTVTAVFGVEGSTRALMKFPPFPQGKALVGYLVITYASAFTGGTTALDTATTQYVSPVGAFDPTIAIL